MQKLHLTPVVAIILLIELSCSLPAHAQHFGRNRVQYRDFEFEVLQTEHFDVHFYPEMRQAGVDTARLAERWYARLSSFFDHDLSSRQPLILYASPSDFQQTNVVQGVGEGTGGVTEGLLRRIVMPVAGTLADTDHVLGHELVHAFQYDISGRETKRSTFGLGRLPLWFVEGMAEYLSIGPVDAHTAMWIRDAARQSDGSGDELPTVGQLASPRYFPYRWGQALWAYVAGRWGDQAVVGLFEEALRAGAVGPAIGRVLEVSSEELSAQWHAAIRLQYDPVFASSNRVAMVARALLPENAEALAVSPSLSPNGNRIVYLSERSRLSVDVYLADVRTGDTIRRLVNTAVDPHFTSLQFIASAGAWHPDGRQFVIGALRSGEPVLATLDVETGQRVREDAFPQFGEILNPSFAPDGQRVVFSATRGGYTDLYIYDLDSRTVLQVTDDRFAELQPAWSPDGSSVAFVTDRFSTDLAQLVPGRFELGVYDVMSARIERVPTFAQGKSINPQWAPDGRSLYFLSDQNGVTNVYVTEVGTGSVRVVTGLDAGASGITALSPALTAATDAQRVAFSAYDEGRLTVYVVDEVPSLSDLPVVSQALDRQAAALPPVRRASNTVVTMLSDFSTGFPDPVEATTPYRPGLKLAAVGQPNAAVTVDRFGTGFGGGIGFLWSDTLGNHNLFTELGVTTYGGTAGDLLDNFSGVVGYSNLTRRWNWAVSAQQSPYLAGGFASGIGVQDGQPVFVEESIVQRQTYRGANWTASYPFSRESRVELGGGYQRTSFETEVRTVTRALGTGRLISDRIATSSIGESLDLGRINSAFVYDSSTFGAVSPIAGQRGRFEVAPTLGTLSFVSALADYRRYFMPVDFYTIVGRVLHYGRYGADGEDSRLLPLFLGYPDLVRGYGVGSFESGECRPGPSGSCDIFDRMLGSRVLVGNLELRFPLLRPFGLNAGLYGPIPTEVALFTDAGVAWGSDSSPDFVGGERRGVSSVGVTLRTNLFGYALVQLDYARPLQRPGRGWLWNFSVAPGF